jgi:hypothetical protein
MKRGGKENWEREKGNKCEMVEKKKKKKKKKRIVMERKKKKKKKKKEKEEKTIAKRSIKVIVYAHTHFLLPLCLVDVIIY